MPRKDVSYIPWIPVVAASSGSTLWSFFPGPLGFLFGAIAAITIVMWLVIAICRFLVSAVRRRWQGAGTRSIRMALAFPLVGVGALAGDDVHLALAYPYYLQQIATKPERPLRFDWGDTAVMAFEDSDLRTLIYDNSRTLPIVTQKDEPAGDVVTTRHFIGPFFLEDRYYQ